MTVSGQDIVNSAYKLLGAGYRTWYYGASIPMWLDDNAGDPPPLEHLRYYGVMCFPGDTKVLAEGIKKSYRRVYSGEFVTIKTASGKKLSGTPNHPILTVGGWVALGKLKKSDRVISSRRFGKFVGPNPDNQGPPMHLKEIHDAFMETWPFERVAGIPLDFHGDGSNGEVDIVYPGRKLRIGIKPSRSKHLPKLRLSLPDLGKVSLISESMTNLEALGARAATREFVSSSRESFALRSRSIGVAESRGFSNTSANTALLEAPVDDALRDTQAGSNLPFGLSEFDVTPDDIIDIKIQAYHGEVYNLQTTTGHYIANGIIAHNCSDLVNWALEDNGLPPGGGTAAFADYLVNTSDFDPSTPGVPGAIALSPYQSPVVGQQGHIAIYVDEHTLIQALHTPGITDQFTDAESYYWGGDTAFTTYGFLPGVDYSGTSATKGEDNGSKQQDDWYIAVRADGALIRNGPDWSSGWWDSGWVFHRSQ